MNGDQYAKGWQSGRGDGIRDVRAGLVRALMARDVITIDDVLAVVDEVSKESLRETRVDGPAGASIPRLPRRKDPVVPDQTSLLGSR